MSEISGPGLVIACCKAGILGSLPASDQNDLSECELTIKTIYSAIRGDHLPWCIEYPAHYTNDMIYGHLDLTVKYQIPILISTLDIDREVVDAIHGYGGLVFHNPVTRQGVKKALEVNVDGIIAVVDGAGPYETSSAIASVSELKPLLGNKTLISAGCLSHGAAVARAVGAGVDLACIGTCFVNAVESDASVAMRKQVGEFEGAHSFPEDDNCHAAVLGKRIHQDAEQESQPAKRTPQTSAEIVNRVEQEYQSALAWPCITSGVRAG